MNLAATDKRIHLRPRDGHDIDNSDIIGIIAIFIAIFGVFATLFSGWLINKIQKRQVERLGAQTDRNTGGLEAGVDHDSRPHESTSASIIPPQGIELPPKALLRTTTADRARSSELLASMSTTPGANSAPIFQQTVNTDNSSSESIGRVEPIVGQYYITGGGLGQ